MKKPLVAVVIIIVTIMIVIGVMSTKRSSSGSGHGMASMPMPSNTQTMSSTATPNQVLIKNYAFGPKTITVKKGTKVTWTNQDGDHHNVQPDQESTDFKAGPLLGKNESYSFTFDKVGSYSYHCSPHPYMKATVEVTQ